MRKINFDYNLSGLYFITICTHYRKDHFGKVINSEMYLSKYGEIAQNCWINIPKHHNSIKLHDFIFMPDHMHGIVEILKEQDGDKRHAFYPTENENKIVIRQHQSLSNIIGSFKSAVTKLINQQNPDLKFKWQISYHDQIIRNKSEFEIKQKYILNNSKNFI